jgi:hypothetical protein
VNLTESRAEGTRLYSDRYLEIRYEDILSDPFKQLTKLWLFLGIRTIPASLEAALKHEVSINPDETWQAERNASLAPHLPKGQTGNWMRFFTQRDRDIFKELAGSQLIEWKYEQSMNW